MRAGRYASDHRRDGDDDFALYGGKILTTFGDRTEAAAQPGICCETGNPEALIEKWQGLAATLQPIRNTAGRYDWRPFDGRPFFIVSIR